MSLVVGHRYNSCFQDERYCCRVQRVRRMMQHGFSGRVLLGYGCFRYDRLECFRTLGTGIGVHRFTGYSRRKNRSARFRQNPGAVPKVQGHRGCQRGFSPGVFYFGISLHSQKKLQQIGVVLPDGQMQEGFAILILLVYGIAVGKKAFDFCGPTLFNQGENVFVAAGCRSRTSRC